MGLTTLISVFRFLLVRRLTPLGSMFLQRSPSRRDLRPGRQHAFPATRFNGRLEAGGLRLQPWTLDYLPPPSQGPQFCPPVAGENAPPVTPSPSHPQSPFLRRRQTPPFLIRTRHRRVNFGFDSSFGLRTRHRRVNFVIPASRFAGAVKSRPDPGAPGLRVAAAVSLSNARFARRPRMPRPRLRLTCVRRKLCT